MYVAVEDGARWARLEKVLQGTEAQDDKCLKTLTFLPEKDEVIPRPYMAGKHLSCVLKSRVLRD